MKVSRNRETKTHRDGDALTASGYKSLESLNAPPPRGVQQIQAQQAQSGATAQGQSTGAAACDIKD